MTDNLNPSTAERAVKLRQMTAEYLRNMTPQQRDRMMQVHLAQARGPIGNITLLRRLTASMLRIKRHRESINAEAKDAGDDGSTRTQGCEDER
jgi:hypothetical protein